MAQKNSPKTNDFEIQTLELAEIVDKGLFPESKLAADFLPKFSAACTRHLIRQVAIRTKSEGDRRFLHHTSSMAPTWWIVADLDGAAKQMRRGQINEKPHDYHVAGTEVLPLSYLGLILGRTKLHWNRSCLSAFFSSHHQVFLKTSPVVSFPLAA